MARDLNPERSLRAFPAAKRPNCGRNIRSIYRESVTGSARYTARAQIVHNTYSRLLSFGKDGRLAGYHPQRTGRNHEREGIKADLSLWRCSIPRQEGQFFPVLKRVSVTRNKQRRRRRSDSVYENESASRPAAKHSCRPSNRHYSRVITELFINA